MAYLHISNLYKAQEILAFKECYALEKIHGTSAHIRWNFDKKLFSIFAGGENHKNFAALFDQEYLKKVFQESFAESVVIYGEAYGGKQQGMSKTYGSELKFIAFDVKIGELWLAVPQAEEIALSLGLEFVHYVKIPATVETIQEEREAPSVQAVRNGITEPRKREGVVLRPLFEVRKNNDERIIAKDKNDDFIERKSRPPVDTSQLEVLTDAAAIAMEWVTPMRLNHVLDKLEGVKDLSLTGKVIQAMVEDVTREAKGEIVETKEARKAIGTRAVKLYKQWLNDTYLKKE